AGQFNSNSLCLNPCFSGSGSLTKYKKVLTASKSSCLNPCFSGSGSLTHVIGNLLVLRHLILQKCQETYNCSQKYAIF
ncbi:MAG: hypothetical protein RIS47_1587, partial [Bacteroidota bacterium]